MSDQQTRALERAAAAGDPEAEVQLLRARRRTAPACERCGGSGRIWTAGVDPARNSFAATSSGPQVKTHACAVCAGTGSPFHARLDLACLCAHPAVRAVLGFAMPDRTVFRSDHDLATFVECLDRFGDIGPARGWVLVQAAVAAARVAFLDQCPPDSGCVLEPARLAIEAAEAWLANPTEERREALRQAVLRSHLPEFALGPSDVLFASGVYENGAPTWHRGPRHAARLAGEAPVRDAICSALTTWALSHE